MESREQTPLECEIMSEKSVSALPVKLAVPNFTRELGQVLNFKKSINWYHHMKDHVEIGHLTKYNALRVNRDQAMNLEIWFKIHTNISNF